MCVFIHAHVGALNRPVLTLAANSLWSTLGSIGQHFQWGHLPSSSLPHTCSPLFLPPLPPSLQAIGSNTPHRCSQAQTVAAGEGDFFFFSFFLIPAPLPGLYSAQLPPQLATRLSVSRRRRNAIIRCLRVMHTDAWKWSWLLHSDDSALLCSVFVDPLWVCVCPTSAKMFQFSCFTWLLQRTGTVGDNVAQFVRCVVIIIKLSL